MLHYYKAADTPHCIFAKNTSLVREKLYLQRTGKDPANIGHTLTLPLTLRHPIDSSACLDRQDTHEKIEVQEDNAVRMTYCGWNKEDIIFDAECGLRLRRHTRTYVMRRH